MGNVILRVLGIALAAISPELRDTMRQGVTALKNAARETANPWDDLLVEVLAAILGFGDD